MTVRNEIRGALGPAGLRRTVRHAAALTGVALLIAALAPGGAVPAAAAHRPASKNVSYRGYRFQIPRSWPVINVTRHPRRCVRFDVHALYLGRPGANEKCPSRILGTTEAIVIQPGPARATLVAQENPTERQISVSAPRLRLLATFHSDAALIVRILASATLPKPKIALPHPLGTRPGKPQTRSGAAAQALGSTRSKAEVPAAVANFHGRGFDTCATPSAGYMAAWRRSSPYRAVGIYIGGADRACDQPNLTRGWVMSQARAGWHFIPLYAGPQAAFGELYAPARQGVRAAIDAVAQAQRLGFGPQTPIYYDMEAYPPGETRSALRFLSAWSIVLHTLGYQSGVYSSSLSGIVDLARQYSQRNFAMPDVIYDGLWNHTPNTADTSFGPCEWVNHQRIHQYRGNVTQTYGGDSINIDLDFLNVRLPAPVGTPQASQAVTLADGAADVFYRGTDGSLWRDSYSVRSGWSRPINMGGADRSVPSVVSTGGCALDVFYQGADRYLWEVSYEPGRGWARPTRLTGLGTVGGAPRTVAQPDGIIDAFWLGMGAGQLWHARYIPGLGWSPPHLLGRGLASYPSPVDSAPDTVQVFWKGTDQDLWYIARRGQGSWTRPDRVGMGPLGGPPRAFAQPNGAVKVIWRGRQRHRVWAAFDGRVGWLGPVALGGDVRGSPWLAAVAGPVHIWWRGPRGALWDEHGLAPARAGFSKPVMLRGPHGLGSSPFAAAGWAGSTLRVFWKGRNGGLWTVRLVSGRAGKPRDLGGPFSR